MLCLLLLTALPASAALKASLDRYSIAMGETVRLTLSSDDGSDPADADLSALEEHFNIIQRSSSVSTRIVNGTRTQNRELLLELTPSHEGEVSIPGFQVDGQVSNALEVSIAPEPKVEAADEIVTFEIELDRDEVYVQGQLLLTMRVQQAVNLESRSITELEIDNAYVEDLGQNSFQRMIDGRPWLVHEIRYAVFPEASGELLIPAQTFSGRMGSGRRTLFDTRPAGRLIRRQSDAISVPVKQRPVQYPDATWLPAANLKLEEQWSAPLDSLKIGDSVTRTITISGDGLQGAQLPPVAAIEIPGLRSYPDQPAISNVNGDAGVTGIRTESLALVAVSAGEYEIPALEIPWWDTQSDSLRMATLPARRVRVLPPVVNTPQAPTTEAPLAPSQAAVDNGSAWMWIALLCVLGWLVTGFLWWRSRQSPAQADAPSSRLRERATPTELLRACRANDPQLAFAELQAWVRGTGYAGSLARWLEVQESPALNDAVRALERYLYLAEDNAAAWSGETLALAVREWVASHRQESSATHSDGPNLPPLYTN